ncbi:DUF397 domain-containing protein [Streptomyces sp. NPDC057555]|uniref:DUF397 domain-containing protein n=1 Tax=Streptomyces sp. NPDC057555 TaxID=3346166 RepID=UPI003692E6AF
MKIHPAKVTPASLKSVNWFKSSYSNGGGNCVEVSDSFPNVVPVRDSKDPYGSTLVFPADGWTSFVSAVKQGEFRD